MVKEEEEAFYELDKGLLKLKCSFHLKDRIIMKREREAFSYLAIFPLSYIYIACMVFWK